MATVLDYERPGAFTMQSVLKKLQKKKKFGASIFVIYNIYQLRAYKNFGSIRLQIWQPAPLITCIGLLRRIVKRSCVFLLFIFVLLFCFFFFFGNSDYERQTCL